MQDKFKISFLIFFFLGYSQESSESKIERFYDSIKKFFSFENFQKKNLKFKNIAKIKKFHFQKI